MLSINVKEARKRFSELLDEAQAGASIAITRRGVEVARLVPSKASEIVVLPDMTSFRDSIYINGPATSDVIVTARKEQRF